MRIVTCLTLLALGACLLAAPALAADKVVPDTVGLALEQAQKLLQQAGCKVEIQYQQGPPAGFVFSQNPGGLAPSPGGKTVTLSVGGDTPKPRVEPTPVAPTVPDAPPSGMGTGEELPPTGNLPGDTDTPLTQPEPSDPIIEEPMEVPSAMGTDIPADRAPNTNGPEIPSVLGQQEGMARRALSAWRVRVEQSPGVANLIGQVINQDPFPGRTLATGEELTIVVAVAGAPDRNWRIAPKATGNSMDDAVRIIRAAGFAPELRSIASEPRDAGRVLSQTPLPGSLQQLGQPVILRVGRGQQAALRGPGSPTALPPHEAPRQPSQPAQPLGDPDAPPTGPGTSPLDVPPVGPTPAQPSLPTEAPLPGTPEAPPAQPEPSAPQQPAPPPRNVARLGTTTLVSPPPGESYPWRYGADFEWTSIPNATSYEWELEEELPSGAWKASDAQTFATKTYRPKTLPRGRYRWRVRAISTDAQGEWSAWQRLYMY